MSSKDVRVFMVCGITAWRCHSFVAGPGGPTKAEPVVAAFAVAVAGEADIIVSSVAAGTVVMEVVLDVFFSTSVAGNRGFRVKGWGGRRNHRGSPSRRFSESRIRRSPRNY